MPYYKQKNLLFIHIPKTGGTVIEDQIKQHAQQTLRCKGIGFTNTILDHPFDKVSLQHQYYNTIFRFKEKLDVDFLNLKIFTVVRNPYDRIISDLFWYKLIKKDSTSEHVYDVIKNNFIERDDLDNHNKPQYKFITDENGELIKTIKIFKTETLNESNDELNKFIQLDIDIKRDNVNKDYSKYLNTNSINLINQFYKKDFELFDYDMK